MAQIQNLLNKRERLKASIYWDKFYIVTQLQGQIGEDDLFSTMSGIKGGELGGCGAESP